MLSQENSVVLKVLHGSFVRLCRASSCERPKILALPGLGTLFTGIEAILPVLEFANHSWDETRFSVATLRLPSECDCLSPQHRDAL